MIKSKKFKTKRRALKYKNRDFYQNFKKNMIGNQSASLCFRWKGDKLALNNEEGCSILVDYFEKLFDCEKPTSTFDRVTLNADILIQGIQTNGRW